MTNNKCILHWISDLLEFHFEVLDRMKKLHMDADALLGLLNYHEMELLPNMDLFTSATAVIADIQRKLRYQRA